MSFGTAAFGTRPLAGGSADAPAAGAVVLTESAALGDLISVAVARATSIAEPSAIADSAAALVAGDYASWASEGGNADSVQGAQVARAGAAEEVVALVEVLTAAAARAGAATEAVALVDVTAVAVARTAACSEPVALASVQTGAAAGEYVGTVEELLNLASVHAASAATVSTINEAIAAATSQASSTAQVDGVIEAVVLFDQVSGGAAGDYAALVLEAIHAVDVTTATRALVAGLLEQLDAGDLVAAVALAPGAYLVAVQEPASLIDAFSALRDPPQDVPVSVSRTRRVVFVSPGRIVRIQVPNRRVTP